MAECKRITVEPLTQEAFAPFGKLIEFSEHPEDERFEVLIREEVHPWRIAMFRVRIRQAQRLECHPESMESFEPVRGMGVLLCAAPDRPEKVHAFPLDAPVCLNKDVWHEVIALSGEALYKITENCEVSSEFYPFSQPVGVEICIPGKGEKA